MNAIDAPIDFDRLPAGRKRSERGYTGYIYVVEFSSGTIKVGKTESPRNRLKSHEMDARKFSGFINRCWVSAERSDVAAAERELIRSMSRLSPPAAGAEYFTGIDFDTAVIIARRIKATTLTDEEVAEAVAASRVRADENIEAWFGKRTDSELVRIRASFHPFALQMLFGPNMAAEWPTLDPVETEEGRLLLAHQVRRLQDLGYSVEDIEGWTYIDFIQFVVRVQVETAADELRVWASRNGREDLLEAGYLVAGGAA